MLKRWTKDTFSISELWRFSEGENRESTAKWATIKIKGNIVSGSKFHFKHIIQRIIDKNAE